MTDDLASRIAALEKTQAKILGRLNETVIALQGRVAALEAKHSDTNGCSLRLDWKPSGEDRIYAKKYGFSADEIDRLGEDFADYWHGLAGQRGRKKDWPATWRTWIRKNADKQGRSPRDDACGREPAQVQSEIIKRSSPEEAIKALMRVLRRSTAEQDAKAFLETMSPHDIFTACRSFPVRSELQEDLRRIIEQQAQALGYRRDEIKWPT